MLLFLYAVSCLFFGEKNFFKLFSTFYSNSPKLRSEKRAWPCKHANMEEKTEKCITEKKAKKKKF
jgi:hypothetical protein